MSQTKKRGLAAFALAILLLALVVAIALRATPQGTAAAQTAPIRLSPASQHGVQLISAEAISGVNDSVRLAFRNVSGRPIRSFSFARGETPDPQGYTGSGRSFGDGIEDHSWAPGDETVVLEDRAGDTPIRISAIEFANGEIIGEEYPAASMLE
ncbi:MAG: hypothetical protein M3Q76_09505, partial [Acidobacteriota bacterium]|nr:hypothetical protein [Acidobacteriota bacterium]